VIGAGISRNTACRLEKRAPGITVDQVPRYVDTIAPGPSLADVLAAQRAPSLKGLEAR
jgi:hypothetical protein